MIAGRKPKLILDEKTLNQITALAQIMCTQKEAAAVLGVAPSTFEHFLTLNPEARDAWYDGKGQGRASLRRILWKQAQEDPSQARFLAKDRRWLAVEDKSVDVNVTITKQIAPEEIDKRINELAQKLNVESLGPMLELTAEASTLDD